MTEYIKAKEYLKAQCEKRKDSLVLEMPQNYITDVEQAFIDGYHECQKEHEWHDVKNGLPINTGLYLIFYYNSFFNDNVRCIAGYSPDKKEFLNINIEDGDEVIAWMELPVPPKEIK